MLESREMRFMGRIGEASQETNSVTMEPSRWIVAGWNVQPWVQFVCKVESAQIVHLVRKVMHYR